MLLEKPNKSLALPFTAALTVLRAFLENFHECVFFHERTQFYYIKNYCYVKSLRQVAGRRTVPTIFDDCHGFWLGVWLYMLKIL